MEVSARDGAWGDRPGGRQTAVGLAGSGSSGEGTRSLPRSPGHGGSSPVAQAGVSHPRATRPWVGTHGSLGCPVAVTAVTSPPQMHLSSGWDGTRQPIGGWRRAWARTSDTSHHAAAAQSREGTAPRTQIRRMVSTQRQPLSHC